MVDPVLVSTTGLSRLVTSILIVVVTATVEPTVGTGGVSVKDAGLSKVLATNAGPAVPLTDTGPGIPVTDTDPEAPVTVNFQ